LPFPYRYIKIVACHKQVVLCGVCEQQNAPLQVLAAEHV